jgi:hypothetical protein
MTQVTLSDKVIQGKYISGRFGSSGWKHIHLQSIDQPDAQWVNTLVDKISREYVGQLIVRAVRIVDAPVQRYISKHNLGIQTMNAYTTMEVDEESAHITTFDQDNNETIYPDIPQFWACPIAIQVRWREEFARNYTNRPILSKLTTLSNLTNNVVECTIDQRLGKSNDYDTNAYSDQYYKCNVALNYNDNKIQIWSTFDILRKLFGIRPKHDEGLQELVWAFDDCHPWDLSEMTDYQINDRWHRPDYIENWHEVLGSCRRERRHNERHHYSSRHNNFEWTLPALSSLYSHFSFDLEEFNDFLKEMKKCGARMRHTELFNSYNHNGGKGFVNVWRVFRRCEERLYNEHPILFCVMTSFVQNSPFKIEELRYTKAINALLGDATDYDSLVKCLNNVWQHAIEGFKAFDPVRSGIRDSIIKGVIEDQPVFSSLMAEAKLEQRNRELKQMFKGFGLTVEQVKRRYPKFTKAFNSEKIPMSLFKRFGSAQIINDRLDLWEKMLKLNEEETLKVVQLADEKCYGMSRSLMGYFNFVLNDLPKYLKKHTKVKWNVNIKHVAGLRNTISGSISVNNITKTVTVPYAIESAEYNRPCVTSDWQFLRKGFAFEGDVCQNEIEVIDGKRYGMLHNSMKACTGRDAKYMRVHLICFEDNGNVDFFRVWPARTNRKYVSVRNWISVAQKAFTKGNTYDVRINKLLLKRAVADNYVNFANTANAIGSDIITSDTIRFTLNSPRNTGGVDFNSYGGQIQVVDNQTRLMSSSGQITLDPGTWHLYAAQDWHGTASTSISYIDVEPPVSDAES